MDDLHLLLEELLDAHVRWYSLGMQLGVRLETLNVISASQFSERDQLLELLKVWLTTSDNTSWKVLLDALRSPTMGQSQLAGFLERKYCLTEDMRENKH